MRRLVAIIAATAAAASVAAIITRPASAGDPAADDARFVTCLRAQGLDIPAGTVEPAIKNWILAHRDEPGTDRSLTACKLKIGGSTAAPEELLACLRDHGLDPPPNLEAFKPWMARQHETEAGKAAQRACGFDARPTEHIRGSCGAKAPEASERKAVTTSKLGRASRR